MLDRFDLQLEVVPVTFQDLHQTNLEEPSSQIRQRVIQARQIQQQRFADSATIHNGAMTVEQIQLHCQLDNPSRTFLEQAFQRLGLSARAHNRILKVARTIADLAGGGPIRAEHIAEAVQFRSLDQPIG